MTWQVCLSWWLSGVIAGLAIANLMVDDEAISWALLITEIVFLIANLTLLLCVEWRYSHGKQYRRPKV